ncbi:M20 family metallo-hydrolase [Lacihabitans soyangensis]|uniref:M20/M25/M40 family metallo-hydrolase n=1 Tax=Lacihabitans soyangensis TaxID=869394 RepID=A0AAE3KSP8_9BACT|nr:M20 family metallo-hydrolase [Lacihabitans soyangensis]MCP9763328.1 M20/M25/M40 family metallo-hydrolase [Lacihabitans soyangensis]
MKNPEIKQLGDFAIGFLTKLIETPSLSKEEDKTLLLFEEFFKEKNIDFETNKNNIWVKNKHFDSSKPTILLNSHHDTVKPNASYTKDPFKAEIVDGKLFGLGSNDAGGPLVSLFATFLYFYEQTELPYNLIFAASAEEEISGKDGIELLIKSLPKIDLAIVGEPTLMDMAVAEKGLMVLDCKAKGVAGHAARNEGKNAIYEALEDINWFRNYEFEKESESLGPIKMAVTVINAGTQHNVVPDECSFVVDVRATDAYSLEETLEIIKQNVKSEVTPRSIRLNPSGISLDHPIVKKGIALGMKPYGSPTLSDQALMPFTSIKIGPGDSIRSHTADEYIFVEEIYRGIDGYVELLDGLVI